MTVAKLEAQALQPGVPQITPPSLVNEAQFGAIGDAVSNLGTALYRSGRGSGTDETGERMAEAAAIMSAETGGREVDRDTFLELTAEMGSEKLAEYGIQISKDAGGRYERFNQASGQSRSSFVNSLRANLEMVEMIKANPYYAREIRQAFSAQGVPTREDLEDVMSKVNVERAEAAETARNNYLAKITETFGVEQGTEEFQYAAGLFRANELSKTELEFTRNQFLQSPVVEDGISVQEAQLQQERLDTLYKHQVGTRVNTAMAVFLKKIAKIPNMSLTEFRNQAAQLRQSLAGANASEFSQDGVKALQDVNALTSLLTRLEDQAAGKDTIDTYTFEQAATNLIKTSNDRVLAKAQSNLLNIPGAAEIITITDALKNADPLTQQNFLQNVRVGNAEATVYEVFGKALGAFITGQKFEPTGTDGKGWDRLRQTYDQIGVGNKLPAPIELPSGQTITGTNEVVYTIVGMLGADAKSLKADPTFLNNMVRILSKPDTAAEIIEGVNRYSEDAAAATLEALNNHFTALTNDMVDAGAGEFGFFQAAKRTGLNTFFKPVVSPEGEFSFQYQATAGGIPPGFQDKLERLNRVIAPQLTRAAKAFAHTIMDSTDYNAAAYELIRRGGFRLDTAGREEAVRATWNFEEEQAGDDYMREHPDADETVVRQHFKAEYDKRRSGKDANTQAGS